MSVVVRDLRQLASLLDDECAALRTVEIGRIDKLGARKLILIERLEGQVSELPPDAVSLGERVARAAQRNQGMIAAALDGIRDAQALVARARMPLRHETYARDGLRQKIDSAPGQLEKRA